MGTFQVKIIERSYRTKVVEVDANGLESAEENVYIMYQNGDVDFTDCYETEEVEFEIEIE